MGTFGWNYGVLMPVLATSTFQGDAGLYGLLLSVIGAGSFVGAIITARTDGGHRRRLVRSSIGMVVALLAVAVAPNLMTVFIALFFLGGAGTAVMISAQTRLQLTVSDEMSGRIMALYSVAFLGSKPLGGVVAGWMIDLSGPRLGFAVGGAAVGAAVVWEVLQARRSRAARSRHPATGTPENVPLGRERLTWDK